MAETGSKKGRDSGEACGWVEAGQERRGRGSKAGLGRSGRPVKGRGPGWRAGSQSEEAVKSAVSEVGGEARWAVKRAGPAEEAG